MKNLFIFFAILLSLSCTTIDMESQIGFEQGIGEIPSDSEELESLLPGFLFKPNIQIVERIVERPVYIPLSEPPPARAAAGADAVRAAFASGVIKPQDYSHAAMIYDYNPDWVYEIYTQPLRVTDICLEPDESVLEAPFISDSDRWVVGGGVSHENGAPVQHIYIKPVYFGLTATLIINTDRRVYRIILRSFRDDHMPLVRWRYPENRLPSNLPQNNNSENANQHNIPNNFLSPQPPNNQNQNSAAQIDPRFLSFNYRITRPAFSKPYWMPELVFDDGAKTYITFPMLVLQREMPVVFENRRDVVNYRVIDNVIVIDKLIENLTIRIDRVEITIQKKKG